MILAFSWCIFVEVEFFWFIFANVIWCVIWGVCVEYIFDRTPRKISRAVRCLGASFPRRLWNIPDMACHTREKHAFLLLQNKHNLKLFFDCNLKHHVSNLPDCEPYYIYFTLYLLKNSQNGVSYLYYALSLLLNYMLVSCARLLPSCTSWCHKNLFCPICVDLTLLLQRWI